jgi:hypothetical protein
LQKQVHNPIRHRVSQLRIQQQENSPEVPRVSFHLTDAIAVDNGLNTLTKQPVGDFLDVRDIQAVTTLEINSKRSIFVQMDTLELAKTLNTTLMGADAA